MWSNTSLVPTWLDSWHVTTLRLLERQKSQERLAFCSDKICYVIYLASVAVEGSHLRAHKELRASPLKPKVSTWMRSEKSLSFDV